MTSSSTFSVRLMTVETIRKSITPDANTLATAGNRCRNAHANCTWPTARAWLMFCAADTSAATASQPSAQHHSHSAKAPDRRTNNSATAANRCAIAVDSSRGRWLPNMMPAGADIVGRSGPSAGCGVSGRWVEMAGFGDAASALGLDTVGPEDAEPVPGSAAGGELAGLDPVVDDADVHAEPFGGVGDADLAGGVGVRSGDMVGVPDPLD